MREREMPTFGIEQVVVQFAREILKQLDTCLVETRAFRSQVIGTDNGGIASSAAPSQVALLEHRNIRDAVIFSQVVGCRQPVSAASDNHRIVLGFELAHFSEHARFRVVIAESKLE